MSTSTAGEGGSGASPLHVVFGTGQVGGALAAHLAAWASGSGRYPGSGQPRGPASSGGAPTSPIPRRPPTRLRVPR